jgi:hypothetical protein
MLKPVSFEREVVGPLLGTYDPYDPSINNGSLPGQPAFLEAGLVEPTNGTTVGRILLILTVWPTTNSTNGLVHVSKQKFFYLPGGQISALGTISLPDNTDLAKQSYFIPIVGGTGQYFGCSGTLNTTTTDKLNVVTYVISLVKPIK